MEEMTIKHLRPVEWAENISDIQNTAGNSTFKSVELVWTKPSPWTKDMRVPDFKTDEPFLYALIRNHGNSRTRDQIEYIGLTKSPLTRFGNHEVARSIVKKRGEVGFSYAVIDFVTGKNRIDRISRALEDIEHLLIWAVDGKLENQKKMRTLPGMGANGGNAWHIKNKGYRFSGRMPMEIVFPWMLIRPGRDRTQK
ncbi:hypothetical protein [Zavarzinia compransoris]|uniref:hypothetical protein n=1 Tax=Zavarzinia compransoris TaxID=1264899 RepID=UPI0010612E23|nr:hypothetical protein [Zavarzinia compransoris]